MTEGLSWAPVRAVFLRRLAWGAGLTFAVLLAIGVGLSLDRGWSLSWVIPTAVLLSIAFAVEDALRWRASRFDRWEITEGHLRHDGQDGAATIPLADIAQVRTGFGGRVVVHLRDGQRIVLRYLPYPVQTAEQIDAARPT